MILYQKQPTTSQKTADNFNRLRFVFLSLFLSLFLLLSDKKRRHKPNRRGSWQCLHRTGRSGIGRRILDLVGDNALIGKHADLALKLANIPTVFCRRLQVIRPCLQIGHSHNFAKMRPRQFDTQRVSTLRFGGKGPENSRQLRSCGSPNPLPCRAHLFVTRCGFSC